MSIAPDGTAHQISLSFNQTENLDNAVLASKSTNGGQGWSDPITLKRDTNPAVFNDKESITADQNDADYVYAVWDRLVFPNERTKGKSYLNTAAFRGPTWFSRSTNGGTAGKPHGQSSIQARTIRRSVTRSWRWATKISSTS